MIVGDSEGVLAISVMEDLSDPPTDINPYEVLEIETTATSSAIKSAYKRLALRHHPGTRKYHAHPIQSLHTSSQTKRIPTPKTPPTPNFKKLLSHTLSSRMSDGANATILRAILQSLSISKTTTSTGLISSGHSGRILLRRVPSAASKISIRAQMRRGVMF